MAEGDLILTNAKKRGQYTTRERDQALLVLSAKIVRCLKELEKAQEYCKVAAGTFVYDAQPFVDVSRSLDGALEQIKEAHFRNEFEAKFAADRFDRTGTINDR